MKFAACVDRYELLAVELGQIISDAENRITAEVPDPYFVKNANFLTKFFLISLCCYLEVFLKEIANEHVACVKQQLANVKVPHNMLMWSVARDVKDRELKFGAFCLSLTKKDIDDELSGNPFRTAKCFRLLGVELDSVPEFQRHKEIVNYVVSKRNNIIHHNDTAVDISLGDIRGYRDNFEKYIRAIASAVSAV